MRFNLFATGLLVSMASALEIEAGTDVLLDMSDNGTVPAQYVRPADNCCIVYLADEWKNRVDKPICWHSKTGRASSQIDIHKKKGDEIYGIDCGKNTWADFKTVANLDIDTSKGWQMGTAGRQQFNIGPMNKQYHKTMKGPPSFRYVRVGKYDSKKMPAATLWRGDCEHFPQRYFYNDGKKHPGEYDIADIAHRLYRLSAAVDAVTLRPGYRVTLYSKNGWTGDSQTIKGMYEAGREKEERLMCQKLKDFKDHKPALSKAVKGDAKY